MTALKVFIICLSCSLSILSHAQVEIPLDLTARVNAKRIYGQQDPSSLATAFNEANFTVLMENGNHLKGKNGIHVQEWNLKVLSEALKKGIGVKLGDFLLAWQLAATAKGGVIQNQKLAPELLSLFLADLKVAINLPKEEISGRRRLAHVIVALGRLNPTTPYDLLADSVSPNVPLNVVQLTLLTQKMSADLWVMAKKQHPQHNNGFKSFYNLAPLLESSCVMSDTEGMIFDTISILSGPLTGTFFDKLVSSKFVSEIGMERYGKVTGIANVVLNYVKFAWSLAAFDAKIDFDKSPLERTKTTVAGENVKIRGTFQMDGSSAQIINCFRPALNAFGIDFSLPQGGPLAGVLVEWQIATKVGAPNDVIQTVGVDPLKQETNKEGFNQITVQGKPQKKDLVDPVIVDRVVPIIATVNLKNKNPAQDAIDLFSMIGGVSSFWTQPLEILNRAPLLFSGKMNLNVRDFKELEGNLFKIEGEYIQLLEAESGANAILKNIKDSFTLTTEVQIRRNVTVDLLTVGDARSQFQSEYPTTYIEGEGCKVQQTAVGDYEAFVMDKNSIELSGTKIKQPDGSFNPKVTIKLKGHRKLRGFKYTYEAPCPIEDIEESFQENVHSMTLTFDNTGLDEIGKSIIIDRRTNGQGWVFRITLVK